MKRVFSFGNGVAEGTGLGSRMTAYRWHLLDPVPFQKSLKFDIEHKGWTFNADGSVKSGFGERVDLMSSVAFWYQEGIALDQPPVLRLREVLASATWQQTLRGLPGYGGERAGQVLSLTQALPWWSFRVRKQSPR